MSSQAITLARPYARAAFSLAREQGRLAQFSQQLAFTAVAVAQPAVSSVLGDPRIAASDLIDVLLPPDADPSFRQFLVVLGENRRLPLLPEIAGLFDELRAEAEKVSRRPSHPPRPSMQRNWPRSPNRYASASAARSRSAPPSTQP